MSLAWKLYTRIAVIILCSILVVGCNTTKTALKVVPTSPPLQIATSSWTSISPPPPGTHFLSYVVSPIEPKTMYACTGGTSITFWKTHDAGQHWSLVSVPATSGTNCSFSISSVQPQRIAFLVTNTLDRQRPCDRDTLYLSTNNGNDWHFVSHMSIAPVGAGNGYCTVTVTDHHLYMWYTYGGGISSLQLSLLERTDNDGATWSRADTSFGSRVFFFSPQVGRDENLAINVRDALSNAKTGSILWISHNAGRFWQKTGVLPLQAGDFLLTTPQQKLSWPTQATPFYTLATEQIPSNLYSLRVFESTNGQQWSAVPPLPVPGASRMHPGFLQALTVTDDGRLLAFGADPKSGVPTTDKLGKTPMSTFWLWIWDPHTAHWQFLTSSLAHLADEACGLCWDGQLSRGLDNTLSLFVYHWDDTSSLFSVRLPAPA